MQQYKAPGVYIEEQQQSPMITGVGTSTAGFVGWCDTTKNPTPAEPNTAILITNFTEYKQQFGKGTDQDVFFTDSYMPYAVYSFFQEGGTRCYVVNVNGEGSGPTPPPPPPPGSESAKADMLIDHKKGDTAYGDFSYNLLHVEAKSAGGEGNCITLTFVMGSVGIFSLTVDDKKTGYSKTYKDAYLCADLASTTAIEGNDIVSQITNDSESPITAVLGMDVTVGGVDYVGLAPDCANPPSGGGPSDGGYPSLKNGLMSGQVNVFPGDGTGGAGLYTLAGGEPEADCTSSGDGGDGNGDGNGGGDNTGTTPGFSNPKLTDPSQLIGTEDNQQGLHAFDVITDVNLILIPDINLLPDDQQAIACNDVLNYCIGTTPPRKDCFFVGDIPQRSGKDMNSSDTLKFINGDPEASPPQPTLTQFLGFGAFYYPWIKMSNPDPKPIVADPDNPYQEILVLPPSGAVAGKYAATDASRGVFKAPAGTVDGRLSLALAETKKVTQTQLGDLNVGCVNVIRSLPGKGVCIWGARTQAGDSSEWKYINIRRLFIFVEQSIKQSSDWIVFEPNGPKLWGTIIRNVTAFLTTLWHEGALYGASAKEAFYVKVDEENNPPIERRKGNLTIEIGIAPMFPAEFVIIKIGQKTLPSS